MNRLEKLALLAAVIGLLLDFEKEGITPEEKKKLIASNDVAWNEACKQISPESFYVLVKSYERKIQNEWK